jgi:serine/threonine protein kinase
MVRRDDSLTVHRASSLRGLSTSPYEVVFEGVESIPRRLDKSTFAGSGLLHLKVPRGFGLKLDLPDGCHVEIVDSNEEASLSDLIVDLNEGYEECEIKKPFAEGACSVMSFVRKGEKRFAVKTIIPQGDTDMNGVQKQFLREMEALKKLVHPFIVRLEGICLRTELEGPKIITEYVSGGTLKDLLRTDRGEKLREWWNEEAKRRIIKQIVLGMDFIHYKGFIHRDLKPANILLDENHNVKIADFGFTRICEPDVEQSVVGSLLHMAPEVMTGRYDFRADVYSFGLILYEIAVGNGLFSNFGNKMRLYRDLQNGNRPEIPGGISPFMRDLITKCWSDESAKRPSFKEIWRELKQYRIYG